jgi:16S rRNA (adenine1518-N6/adenine1519-N6)-dimethyltransferase
MSQYNHYPRKRFGQNFLLNEEIIRQIVAAIAPIPTDHIVEIGPGLGALTKVVLPLVGEMDVVELDRDLIPKLEEICKPLGNVIIHQADALNFDFASVVKNHQALRIIGNLPYNISTPLLFHLLEFKQYIGDMHFMLQKEVVERLTAAVGSSEYNRLSVMTQYHCQTEMLLRVPAAAFYPAPKVESAVVRLIPYQTPPHLAKDYQQFSTVVRLAFAHRRKTLRNNLREMFSGVELEACAINPQARAQDLSVADFVRLANMYV